MQLLAGKTYSARDLADTVAVSAPVIGIDAPIMPCFEVNRSVELETLFSGQSSRKNALAWSTGFIQLAMGAKSVVVLGGVQRKITSCLSKTAPSPIGTR